MNKQATEVELQKSKDKIDRLIAKHNGLVSEAVEKDIEIRASDYFVNVSASQNKRLIPIELMHCPECEAGFPGKGYKTQIGWFPGKGVRCYLDEVKNHKHNYSDEVWGPVLSIANQWLKDRGVI